MNKTHQKKLQKYKTHDEFMLDNFRKNPAEMEIYLKVALEEYETDGDVEAFLFALGTITEAQGGISTLAQKSKLNRQNLYKVLSAKVQPRFTTIETILKALGFGLSVHAMH